MQLLYEQLKSQVEISKTVKCSLGSVQYAIELLTTTGSHQNRARTGLKTDLYRLPRPSVAERVIEK